MPTFGDWQQPADRNTQAQVTGGLLARQGQLLNRNTTSNADWHLSLGEAYAGLLITSTREGTTEHAGLITTDTQGTNWAHVQVAQYRFRFVYSPVSDTPPVGVTVEFEAPSGVPVGAGTISGEYYTDNTTVGGPEFGWTARQAVSVQDWYTPTQLAGLASLGAFPYVAQSGSTIIFGQYSFPVTPDDITIVFAYDAITAGFLSPVFESLVLRLPSIFASRLYRPPRWRFVYPDVLVTPPLRMRQRDDGPRRQGRNGATSVQGSVRQVGRGGYV